MNGLINIDSFLIYCLYWEVVETSKAGFTEGVSHKHIVLKGLSCLLAPPSLSLLPGFHGVTAFLRCVESLTIGPDT